MVNDDEVLRRAVKICKAHGILHGAVSFRALIMEIDRLHDAINKSQESVQQTLGPVLGYPRYVDDLANFPDATDADGVCIGPNIAESIADEAAEEIKRLRLILDKAWAASGLLCPKMTGVPGQAWEEPSDLVAEIALLVSRADECERSDDELQILEVENAQLKAKIAELKPDADQTKQDGIYTDRRA